MWRIGTYTACRNKFHVSAANAVTGFMIFPAMAKANTLAAGIDAIYSIIWHASWRDAGATLIAAYDHVPSSV